MGNWGSVDFESLKSLQRRLHTAVDTGASEQFTREVLMELANMVLVGVKPRTPVDSGELRRRWMIGMVQQRGSTFEIEVYNNVSYAPFVENGHRVVINGQTVGWCEGFYMLQLTMLEIERIMPTLIGQRSQEFINSLMKG